MFPSNDVHCAFFPLNPKLTGFLKNGTNLKAIFGLYQGRGTSGLWTKCTPGSDPVFVCGWKVSLIAIMPLA